MDYPTLGEPIHKPLTELEVKLEANRCLNCYDAPCMNACPTHIDVASFIGKIATGNLKGSARVILDANAMGASCARVCPTEELCEGACVYKKDDSPIRIGDLQRYAIDWVMDNDVEIFTPGPSSGKHVAIIGGGPAGLSAARDLRRFGHAVTIFDSNDQLGGLNTYGIVPFRLSAEVAIWEAQQVVKLGANVVTNAHVGRDITLASLLKDFDAVVLACGMGRVPKLAIPGEELGGVLDALDFIERAKLGKDVGNLGKHVAVIGAGNTAIDALTCAKRLGAEHVTMYYRRGEAEMTAYEFEYDFAKMEGIEFRFFCAPKRIIGENGRVSAVEFIRTELVAAGEGVLESLMHVPKTIQGSEFIEPADTIISAIGQSRLLDTFAELGIRTREGVVDVDESLQTSRHGVFAAGDCIFEKGTREAMVVEAAEQGKVAARSVDAYLNDPSLRHGSGQAPA
ncbi:MAG: NAD(P)-dependent oxidoreductase [Candidatus Eremiobacteraeota bacterium]|nr:NAD(P)-dependent oxidoreductase [Candidatus Eremiobacteraeota bacterium]